MRHTNASAVAIAAAALALTLANPALTAGPEGSAAPVFTIDQAAAGKVTYAKHCASCHLPDLSGKDEIPALAGRTFKETWGSRTTKDLLDYTSAAMPYGGPSLKPDEYQAILAFILQSNGAAAGSQALSTSTVVRIDSVTAD